MKWGKRERDRNATLVDVSQQCHRNSIQLNEIFKPLVHAQLHLNSAMYFKSCKLSVLVSICSTTSLYLHSQHSFTLILLSTFSPRTQGHPLRPHLDPSDAPRQHDTHTVLGSHFAPNQIRAREPLLRSRLDSSATRRRRCCHLL